jgi:AcrR family transcriptional regulator
MPAGQTESPPPGLRERKKRQTRSAIAAAGRELFAANGFHETTIRQIADAAGVSARTVSGYFPVKEEIVFAEHEDLAAELAEHLATRAEGEPTVDALARWLIAYVAEQEPGEDKTRRCVKQLAASDPSLRAYERRLQEQAEQMIAASVAADLGLPEGDLLPRMVGAATIAALDSLDGGGDEPSPAEARRLIDQTMSFIGAGVRELAGSRPTSGPRASDRRRRAAGDSPARRSSSRG